MVQLVLHPEWAPSPLPEKHYAWFKLANAHPSTHWKRHWWFPFKEKFLARYAVRDGYDLQIIEYKCYNCDDGCERCEDGVYSRKEVPLERWIFPNGDVYHKPSQSFPAGRPECYKSTIKGLITHGKISERSSIRAAIRLFFVYDRSKCLSLVDVTYGPALWMKQLNERTWRIQWRIRNAWVRLHNRLFPSADDGVPF